MESVLGYPPSFFSLPDRVFGPSASEFYHRKRQSLSSRLLSTLHAKLNIRMIHISRLLRSVEIVDCTIPQLDPEEFGGADEVARATRAAWNMRAGPIPELVTLIEDAGGIVVSCDFGTPLLDAVSRWVPGLPPVFFINAMAPGDRQRLSLAHELGHMVMHQAPSPAMEDEAFLFASEFLMPAVDIRAQVADATIPKLAAMKPYWRVSMAALLYRTDTLGLLGDQRRRYLWSRMGPYRKREPVELDVAREQPRLLLEVVAAHQHALGFSTDELASMLHCQPGKPPRCMTSQKRLHQRNTTSASSLELHSRA